MKRILNRFLDWFFESWIWGVIAIIIVFIKPDIMMDKPSE